MDVQHWLQIYIIHLFILPPETDQVKDAENFHKDKEPLFNIIADSEHTSSKAPVSPVIGLKVTDKLTNRLLFHRAAYDKLCKDMPKMKCNEIRLFLVFLVFFLLHVHSFKHWSQLSYSEFQLGKLVHCCGLTVRHLCTFGSLTWR
uniref:Uncharacterized protein n=1 Tax=Electrophorus electricus TaxID=8005 RepID=A0A4W4H3A2_ELEEL